MEGLQLSFSFATVWRKMTKKLTLNLVYIQLVHMGSSCISVFNDGSTRDLMSLTGTVPVSYRGKESYSKSNFYLLAQVVPYGQMLLCVS